MRSASTLAHDAKKCARHAQAHTKTRMQQARTQHARNHTSRVGEHLRSSQTAARSNMQQHVRAQHTNTHASARYIRHLPYMYSSASKTLGLP